MEAEAKQRDLDQAKVNFQNIDDRYYLLATELNLVRNHNNQLQLLLNDRGMVRITTFKAPKPQSKSFPQWAVMVPGGSALMLLIAVGLALLI
jgi:hypothetical protein